MKTHNAIKAIVPIYDIDESNNNIGSRPVSTNRFKQGNLTSHRRSSLGLIVKARYLLDTQP
ncbi:MAG TPA: hypothetical protein VJL27_00140 [Patescibacteria group bacterium]|nr:hypothetical protein [Patescibacteria group bacterium]